MNKIFLAGRLTKDPEVKYTPSGRMVTTFTLVVDRPFTSAAAKEKGEKEADFIPIVVWGNTAEYCGNYLNKGSKIFVGGRLQLRSNEGKDGVKKYATEVIANHLEALERSKGAKTETAATNPDDIPSSFGTDVGNEDVPF